MTMITALIIGLALTVPPTTPPEPVVIENDPVAAAMGELCIELVPGQGQFFTTGPTPLPCGPNVEPGPISDVDPVTGCTRAVPSTNCPWDIQPEPVVVATGLPPVSMTSSETHLDVERERAALIVESRPASQFLRYI